MANAQASKLTWNFGSLALVGVSGIVVNLVLGRLYDAAAIGTFNQVFAIFLIAGQLGALGVHLSAQKHLSEYLHDPRIRSASLAGALALISGIGLITTVAYLLFAQVAGEIFGSPAVARGMQLTGIGLGFFVLNKLLFGALNGLDWLRGYAILQAARPLALIGGILYLAGTGTPAADLPLALTWSEGLVCLAGWSWLGFKELRALDWREAQQWVSTHSSFALRGSISNILVELNTRVDILVLGLFVSDSAVGVYSFSAMLAEGFAQLPVVVRTVYHPQTVRLLAQGNVDAVHDMAKRLKRMVYAGMGVVSLAAVALFPFVVPFLTQAFAAAEAWPVFGILMLGLFLSSGYMPMSQILMQGGFPGRHSILMMILVAVNAVGNFAFIPVWGLEGAAVATTISFTLLPLLVVGASRKYLGVRPW